MSSNRRAAVLSSNKLLIRVGRDVRTRRAAFVLVAFVMAATFPLMLPFSRDNAEASAEVVVSEKAIESEAAAVMPRPPMSGTPESVNDAAQAASMVLVGALLIGIGSVVRRAA